MLPRRISEAETKTLRPDMELKPKEKMNVQIRADCKAHLSVHTPRQVRKRERIDLISDNWDRTFGPLCDSCGERHAAHAPCEATG